MYSRRVGNASSENRSNLDKNLKLLGMYPLKSFPLQAKRRLPSQAEVIARIEYERLTNSDRSCAISTTMQEIVSIWQNFGQGLQVAEKQTIRRRLKKLYEAWITDKGKINKLSKAQCDELQTQFRTTVCDISHPMTQQHISKIEDQVQQNASEESLTKNQKLNISTALPELLTMPSTSAITTMEVDTAYDSETISLRRSSRILQQSNYSSNRQTDLQLNDYLLPSSQEFLPGNSEEIDREYMPLYEQRELKHKTVTERSTPTGQKVSYYGDNLCKEILTNNLSIAGAHSITATTFQNLLESFHRSGFRIEPPFQMLNHIKLSQSSLYREMQDFRKRYPEMAKKSYVYGKPLTLHFDAKRLKSIASDDIIDQLIIAVSTTDFKRFIKVAEMTCGKGKVMANEIIKVLEADLDLKSTITCMSFDTTSANTGHLRGACILVE